MADGPQSWRVLPGGLVRLAPRGELMASMQAGGSSADCWVITQGEVDATSLLQSAPTTLAMAQAKRPVTSRAAENLFWLGRYTERAENSIRLAQIILRNLHGEEQTTRALQGWMSRLAVQHSLVAMHVPLPPLPALSAQPAAHGHAPANTHASSQAPNSHTQVLRVFERKLIKPVD